jgi:hypothetical protein
MRQELNSMSIAVKAEAPPVELAAPLDALMSSSVT